jgi:hypothetical protein
MRATPRMPSKCKCNWDLPNVKENLGTTREIIKFLGIEKTLELVDCTKQDVKDAIKQIEK